MADEGNDSGKRRLLLIVHGSHAADLELRQAVQTLRDQGTPVDVRLTWEQGDAARYAKEAALGPFDVAVAAGGDGTLNEVVNGILEADEFPQTAVAVVPLGTANDFANSALIPLENMLDALRLAADGEMHSIDVGRLNGRYFLNVVSGGFGAEVTANTPVEMKHVLGGAAYSLMGLITALNFQPYEAQIQIGEEVRRETLLMLAVGNGRQCGGGYLVAPKALIDDGLLDIVLARNAGFAQWRAVYQELADPELDEYQFVDYVQATSFKLETPEPFQMNLDGEPLRGHSFEFEILEKRLPFVLPVACPLLSALG